MSWCGLKLYYPPSDIQLVIWYCDNNAYISGINICYIYKSITIWENEADLKLSMIWTGHRCLELISIFKYMPEYHVQRDHNFNRFDNRWFIFIKIYVLSSKFILLGQYWLQINNVSKQIKHRVHLKYPKTTL